MFQYYEWGGDFQKLIRFKLKVMLEILKNFKLVLSLSNNN